ncbi:hypothetical protein [Cedecea sp.]|jgi:hypothetical protein|uniref:hypothetical protein n=1 Tax=Cedecea sp. TaxID=1970739 RepID=UPI002F42F29F
MTAIEKINPEGLASTSDNNAPRTWQDDMANQPETTGTGTHGERMISPDSLRSDNLRQRLG